MKKIILFLSSCLFLLAQLNININQIVKKIKKLNTKKVFLSFPHYNPFYFDKNVTKIVLKRDNIKLVLNAIFNKSANINGKWVRVGEFIYGYKVIKIYLDRVLLKYKNRFLWLTYNSNKVLK